MKLPVTGTQRNVLTKLDDHGYYASLQRIEGESTTNFRTRIASTFTRPGDAAVRGLTDSIARELSLGHENLISVTTDRDVRLDVKPEMIIVSGAAYSTVDIVDVDVDGYWVTPTLGKVVSGLNAIAGITATVDADKATMPAILLEEQSSYVHEFNETVPPATNFRLGLYDDGRVIPGTVLSGTISFTDDITFATQVSGTPLADGQWSVDTNQNSIRVYSLPPAPVQVVYSYNILQSGMTMQLIGNGVKVLNLMQAEVQNMLFQNSGIGATARSIVDELRTVDGAFWGE